MWEDNSVFCPFTFKNTNYMCVVTALNCKEREREEERRELLKKRMHFLHPLAYSAMEMLMAFELEIRPKEEPPVFKMSSLFFSGRMFAFRIQANEQKKSINSNGEWKYDRFYASESICWPRMGACKKKICNLKSWSFIDDKLTAALELPRTVYHVIYVGRKIS